MPATALRSLACLIALLGAAHAAAAPAQLDEWRDWVLERHVDSSCPWQLSEPPARRNDNADRNLHAGSRIGEMLPLNRGVTLLSVARRRPA